MEITDITKNEPYRSWVEVDLDGLAWNWKELRRLVGPSVQILQVVKADAYGHGAVEIANMALKNGASWLGVANADEGVQLRVSGIGAPILILSPPLESEIRDIIKYRLTPSVSDLHFTEILHRKYEAAGITGPIHIEIDTGMGRGGMRHDQALAVIRKIAADFSCLQREGIFSHLAASEEKNGYSREQGRVFKELTERLAAEKITFPYHHMNNSGGVFNYPEFNFDLVRPGLMTFGVYPSPELVDKARLIPVMSFKTRILLVKDFPKGYSIGYGRTYTTRGPTRIATIPVGYGDGYGVILSNQGETLIRGKRAPIVGRVSMDMCTIDVSHIPECRIGDEVVLLGKSGGEKIEVHEIAARSQTISYEILCALGKRAPRVFVSKGKKEDVEPRLRRIYIPGEEKSLSRIDAIIRQCLQARAGNEELGGAIFSEIFETLFGKDDRQLELRTNFRYAIHIADFSPEEKSLDLRLENFFKVTTHVEYCKTIREETLFIACAQNNDQLDALFRDPLCEYRWLLSPEDQQNPGKDFRLIRFAVDGQTIPPLRSVCTKRGYEVWCGGEALKEKINKNTKIEFELVSKKPKGSNTFSIYLAYPTQGLNISFDYSQTNIRNVRDVAFFAGRTPHPRRIRTEGKSIELQIDDQEWIFPNSGVTFIWNQSEFLPDV